MIGHGVASYGSGDRYLGMLAATLGDFARAERHFEAALELNERMGAMTWLAHTHFEYGRTLLRNGEPERAGAQLAEAGALADRHGLTALRARIESLGPTAATDNPSGLSDRELEILRLVARGLSNREIGAELFISEHTAANHIRAILRKTGSANRTEATAFAYEHGLVDA
jgi:DNA-binding CsgD family transcriptional regulator